MEKEGLHGITGTKAKRGLIKGIDWGGTFGKHGENRWGD